MKTDIAIQISNVSKVYPLRHPQMDEEGNLVHEHWALKDVSLEIKKGESVGIIGPNGSGKSTLLKILAGVTKPTQGEVKIRGKVASILDIGAGFHPELSGRENVYLNGQIHGFSKKEIASKFDEIVAFSGIEKFIDEPVKNYSNGMYLRLAFSIMAHLDFDVYLLDEVLSVGDAEFQNKCIEMICDLSNNNKTVISIYHNMIVADKIIDREIDIRTIQKNTSNIYQLNFLDAYFNEVCDYQYLDQHVLKLKIPNYTINKNELTSIFTIVSSAGVTLAVSEEIKIKLNNKQNYFVNLNVKLAKGTYLVKQFDCSISITKPLYVVKLNVLSSKVSKHESTNKLIQSVLLFNVIE